MKATKVIARMLVTKKARKHASQLLACKKARQHLTPMLVNEKARKQERKCKKARTKARNPSKL